jgi:ABC-type nitrate/sulfonate/bicarbonate transport system substrate-binding protein
VNHFGFNHHVVGGLDDLDVVVVKGGQHRCTGRSAGDHRQTALTVAEIAALQAGQIDAFYSPEGAALARIESGELRLLLSLSDIYPKPYTAVVVWAASDLIDRNPDLVARFVTATLETVTYLQRHPSEASEFYTKRTGASKTDADRAIASLNHVLMSDGRGSGQDLVAAVAGNWRFMTEAGAVPAGVDVRVSELVDSRFLPQR